MTCAHTLGFPRIGAKRELKFALESYWRGETSQAELIATCSDAGELITTSYRSDHYER